MRHTLFQYGSHQGHHDQGIMTSLVARNLVADEGITVDPESIVITVGCQEAMFLVLRARFMPKRTLKFKSHS